MSYRENVELNGKRLTFDKGEMRGEVVSSGAEEVNGAWFATTAGWRGPNAWVQLQLVLPQTTLVFDWLQGIHQLTWPICCSCPSATCNVTLEKAFKVIFYLRDKQRDLFLSSKTSIQFIWPGSVSLMRRTKQIIKVRSWWSFGADHSNTLPSPSSFAHCQNEGTMNSRLCNTFS